MFKKIAFGLTLAASPLLALTQNPTAISMPAEGGAYLQDGRRVIVRSGYDLCWRTGYWTPADAIPGCDGDLAPPVVVNPTAPPIVQPPVAQATETTPAPEPKRCDFTVTLQSDETFGFNRAVLTSAARKRLDVDVLARLAECATIEGIMITGHTDRLGSDAYNQKLSEKRAQIVAVYLKKKEMPTAVITTTGAGETSEIQACDDKLRRAQLISCLAPNRRVTVEIRGWAR